MATIVLDASTAVKWVLPDRESLVEEAISLLQKQTDGELSFIAPDLFWAEFGQVLTKAVRMNRLTSAAAAVALDSTYNVPIGIHSSQTLGRSALDIATITGRSFYDSLYVALAKETGAPLITADERLANALAARWPVKWLGALF